MALSLYQKPKFEQSDGSFTNTRFVIGIAAGKGGVGKSTVAVNLALALQLQGYQVGILDADLYGPSIRKMLPENDIPTEREKNRLQPALCNGIKTISISYFRKKEHAATIRAPIANQLITYFINNVDWGELDFLFIDFPPGTGDIQLTLAQKGHLTGAVMITTPQEVALLDVRKAIELFKQVNIPILGIIENMSYFEEGEKKHYLFGQGGGRLLSTENHCPLFGQIPIHPFLGLCADQGQSIFAEEKSPPTLIEIFKEIASQIAKSVEGEDKKNLGIFELIWEKSNTVFSIEWNDHLSQNFSLCDVQRNCPCANCVDENTGKRIAPATIHEDVRAIVIRNVGRYGIQIQFTSGCSKGIYHFDYLRFLKEKKLC